jgi:hypothetical protein
MVNSVKARSNHYETLGLTPAATEDEIKQAFAQKMTECRWHPMGTTAPICIAYETLSNRIKRADYDRLHGLAPKPQPRLQAMTVTQQKWAPFVGSVATNALGQAARDEAAEPHVTAPLERQAPEAGTGSFIASSLRDLARPAPRPRAQERPRPGSVEPEIRQMLAARLAEGGSARDYDDRLIDWKKPVLAVGGFIVAAGLIGAFAGLSVRNDEGSTQPETAESAAAPAATRQVVAALPEASTVDIDSAAAVPLKASGTRASTTAQRRHSWAAPRRAATDAPVDSAVDGPTEAIATDQVATDAPATQPVAADLPLSHATIARTINRVGSGCGEVTSTAAAGDGGFSVTCSSGQTYKATRVHGRYRFHRSH